MSFLRFFYNITKIPLKLSKIFYLYFNRLFFILAGVKLGKDMRAVNRVYIDTSATSYVEIGNNFAINSGDSINPLSRNLRSTIFVGPNAKLKIGNDSGISSACIWASESIIIGNYVNIGANAVLIDTDAHSLDWRIRMTLQDTQNAKSSPIVVGDGVLIGTGSIILKGVTIGEHSVVGAGSVVSRSIPANCIAAGNPAKVIKYFEK